MSKKHKRIRKRRKIQLPTNNKKWNRHFAFYHNMGSKHFLLGVAEKGDHIAGHDLTTHPSLNKNNKPKRKYLKLVRNPNSRDKRVSYINKHLRKDVKKHFSDTGNLRLTLKKNWKLSKRDKKRVRKIDYKKL